MLLFPGQILNNRYRIDKLLGQGGFGAVYRAWDLNLDRPRALKENLNVSPDARRQFKREAQMLCDLTHPNLPKVIDHFVIPGQGQYLAMEFIEGLDLQEMLLQNRRPLPVEKVLFWIDQVCDALIYLHSQIPPVIHRDVKPANIRIAPVRRDGSIPEQDLLHLPVTQTHPYLVDFGIAKVFDPQMRTALGARAVTPGYSPVEQYGQGVTDAQSDVYALGATVYHLLTGIRPPASVDLMSKTTPPLPPASLANPSVSPQVSAAIQKAMQLERSNRWSSMAELKRAMSLPRTLLRPQPSASGSSPLGGGAFNVQASPVIQGKQAPTIRVNRPFPWKWIGVLGGLGLAVLIVAAVLVGYLATQGKISPAPITFSTMAAEVAMTQTSIAAASNLPAGALPGSETPGAPPTTQPATTSPCSNAAKFVSETIPDDTQMAPGQLFTKMWRLANIGTCTWSKRYSIAFYSGDNLSAVDSVALPGDVAPGQSVDIQVNMIAPLASGVYQGDWKFKDESGNWFGFGEDAESPFWVRIRVAPTPP